MLAQLVPKWRCSISNIQGMEFNIITVYVQRSQLYTANLSDLVAASGE